MLSIRIRGEIMPTRNKPQKINNACHDLSLRNKLACESFICVRLFMFFHVANGVEINTTV